MPSRLFSQLGPFTKRKLAGFAFIYLAGLGWLTDIIVPFTNLPHKAIIFTVALCIAEASFLIGLALLGKAYYKQIKQQIARKITKNDRP